MEEKKRYGIPKYTLGEELVNSISHGLGAIFGIVVLVLCVINSVRSGSTIGIVSGSIYGSAIILLYTISTIYHALKVNLAKKVFRTLDHCSIYILIAGTYTPYTLITLSESVGLPIFCGIWAVAIVGIVFSAINVHKFRVLSMIIYISMGWAIVFSARPLAAALPEPGLWLLVSGGIAYTAGAVLYGIGKRVKYMHSVFHFFVLSGSVCHFLSIILYVL